MGLFRRRSPPPRCSRQPRSQLTRRSAPDAATLASFRSSMLPEISGSMLERKLASVAASGADRLVSCDLGCLMHLGGGLRRRGSAVVVQHLAQVLDEALP